MSMGMVVGMGRGRRESLVLMLMSGSRSIKGRARGGSRRVEEGCRKGIGTFLRLKFDCQSIPDRGQSVYGLD